MENYDLGGIDRGLGHVGGGHGGDRGNKVVPAALQPGTLGRLCLGLVLADSPMGVSAVTLQGAGREPCGRQGLELIATAAGTHRKREPENYGR